MYLVNLHSPSHLTCSKRSKKKLYLHCGSMYVWRHRRVASSANQRAGISGNADRATTIPAALLLEISPQDSHPISPSSNQGPHQAPQRESLPYHSFHPPNTPQLAISCVNTRLANPDPDRRDLLAKLIEEFNRGTTNLTEVDIQTEAFGFIVAGSHTTAATISCLFHLLLHHPTTLSALETELLSSPQIATLTSSALPEQSPVPYALTTPLAYLSALVTETLRHTPVFTMPLMRVVPSPGAVIASHRIPAGTDVSVCSAVLHRDKAVFGQDADTFKPERWLEKEYVRAHKELLFGFGAGHRACIGRNLATVEIQKVVATVVGRYRVGLVGEVQEGGEAEMESFGISDLKGGLWVRLERR